MKIIKILATTLLVLTVVAGFNWSKIERLIHVKTLFDADKIVYSLSAPNSTVMVKYNWNVFKPLFSFLGTSGSVLNNQ